MTEANQSYFNLISSICKSSPDAERWLLQAIEAASVWDHALDGDEPDKGQTDRTMMALMTEWPLNPFFNKFAPVLIPSMVNAIANWRSSDETSNKLWAYSVYIDLPTIVAYLLGGQPLVDEFADQIRRRALEMMVEDDSRDDN